MAQDIYPPMPDQPVSPGGQAFVQPTAPTGVTGAFLWVQTGLGDSGDDWTIWIETGES